MANLNNKKKKEIKDLLQSEKLVIDREASLYDARVMMMKHHTNYIPVRDHHLVIGIVTKKAIQRMAETEENKFAQLKVHHAMSDSAASCPVDIKKREALTMMEKNKVEYLLVSDKDDIFVGSLSRSDINREP